MWQPIETAPKDGSYFLACKGRGVVIGRMGKATVRSGSDGKGGLKEWVEDCFRLQGDNLSWNPTHWMPLPEPPAKLAPLDVPAVLERIHSDDLAPEGMASTLLHTPSDPAGTALGDLPLTPPPAQAPSQQYRPDGTPLNPTFLPDLPSIDPLSRPSMTSEDLTLKEREKAINGK